MAMHEPDTRVIRDEGKYNETGSRKKRGITSWWVNEVESGVGAVTSSSRSKDLY
jgi:hypothetical protein